MAAAGHILLCAARTEGRSGPEHGRLCRRSSCQPAENFLEATFLVFFLGEFRRELSFSHWMLDKNWGSLLIG